MTLINLEAAPRFAVYLRLYVSTSRTILGTTAGKVNAGEPLILCDVERHPGFGAQPSYCGKLFAERHTYAARMET